MREGEEERVGVRDARFNWRFALEHVKPVSEEVTRDTIL